MADDMLAACLAREYFVRRQGCILHAGGKTLLIAQMLRHCRWDEPMEAPSGANAADVGVGQWATGMSFGQFSELTIQKHYQSAANGNAGHSVVVHLG